MTVPNLRDPDLTQIVRNLRQDLADLKATVIGRWGRIPHGTSDPTSPDNGSVWVRDDLLSVKFRSAGASYAIGSIPIAYTPTLGNVTGGTAAGLYTQIGPKTLFVRAYLTAGTATASNTITIGLPTGVTHNSLANMPWRAANGTTGCLALIGVAATSITVFASDAGALWGVGASVASVSVACIVDYV